jgi:hypothetical protein
MAISGIHHLYEDIEHSSYAKTVPVTAATPGCAYAAPAGAPMVSVLSLRPLR